MSTATRLARVTGALLGAAAGDALGWPQELRGGLVGGQSARDKLEPQPRYRAWVRNGGNHWGRSYKDPVDAGEYSDDTQLLLATARACLGGNEWLSWFSRVELPAWLSYQRGGGGAVLSAARVWSEGRAPWIEGRTTRSKDAFHRYFQAGANGVAMRIAPHVLSTQHHDELAKRVLLDGVTTHGHPRALVGGLVYAAAMATAIGVEGKLEYGELVEAARDGIISFDEAAHWLPERWLKAAGSSFNNEWANTNAEMTNLLEQVAKSLRQGALSNAEETLRLLQCVDSKISGAGTVTTAGAIYLASRAAARPMSGLLSAAFAYKADTDTLASMTGGLLGAVHGDSWLDELANVQDETYIRSMARMLGSVDLVDRGRPTHDLGPRQRELRQRLPTATVGSRGFFPDGRQYRVTNVTSLDGPIVRGRLELDDGQTVYVDVQPPREHTARQTPPLFDVDRAPSSSKAVLGVKTDSAPSDATAGGYIILLASGFEACVDFYARLLARDIPIEKDDAKVLDWLWLRRSSSPASDAKPEMIVIQTKRSLPAVASSVDGELVNDSSGMYVLAHDPDGRPVRLENAD